MKKKQWINDYLSLSRRERWGITGVVVLVALFFLLPSVLPTSPGAARPGPADTAWITAMKKLEQPVPENGPGESRYSERNRPYPGKTPYGQGNTRSGGTLFYFDPNTLDEAGWRQLGLREKTIKTILNYTSKGGKFRMPEDLKRIYGLFPDEFERIQSYIRIGSAPVAESKEWPTDKIQEVRPARFPATKKPAAIEINTADTSDWIALPGIGSKLAHRIVLFREKLGGFYAIEQVAETFGLADSVYQQIRPLLRLEQPVVKKININTASAEDFKKHPYLKWAIVNTLIAYRKEHGPFTRLEDLKKIQSVTSELYAKISPYLILQ